MGIIRLFRRRKSLPRVSCPLCWSEMVEDHYKPHFRWHVACGDVGMDGAQQEAE